MNLVELPIPLFLFRVWNFLRNIFSWLQNNAVNFSWWLYLYQIGHLYNLRNLFYKSFEFEFFFRRRVLIDVEFQAIAVMNSRM